MQTIKVLIVGIVVILFIQPTTIDKIRLSPEQRANLIKVNKATLSAAQIYARHSCGIRLARQTAVDAIYYKVDVRLVAAVVIAESSCNPRAKSPTGAIGLMQIMPKTWHATEQQLYDPNFNLKKGSMILAYLIHMYGVDQGIAMYLGSSDEDETEAYVDRVKQIAGYRSER